MNWRNWELYKNSQAGQETIDCFERGDLASILALVGDFIWRFILLLKIKAVNLQPKRKRYEI